MNSFCDKSTSEFFQESLPMVIGSLLAIGIGRFATSINDDFLVPVLKRGIDTYEDSMFLVIRKGKQDQYRTVQETVDDPDCLAIRYANIATDFLLFLLVIVIIMVFTRLYCRFFTRKSGKIKLS